MFLQAAGKIMADAGKSGVIEEVSDAIDSLARACQQCFMIIVLYIVSFLHSSAAHTVVQ
jgi:hypothetical protein